MKGKSILLALSGSEQSRQAAQSCWALAQRLGATITAHHVIDSHSAWEFLGHKNPGFMSSDTCIEAYQQLVSSLFKLGKELAANYAQEAKQEHSDNVCLIDEGDPIKEICRRSADHTMVVIGHKPSNTLPERSQFQRLSVAESLAHDCPRPLLIVQNKCPKWSSLSIMLSLDHINEVYINSCLDMAMALGLQASLICLTGGAHEENAADFVRDMRQSNNRIANVPIALAPAKEDIAVNVESWYAPDNLPFNQKLFANTLIVIPTRLVAGERLTVVDSSPSLFVRHLKLASILLWPEEYEYRFSGLQADSSTHNIRNQDKELASIV